MSTLTPATSPIHPPDSAPADAECPTRDLLDRLGTKWVSHLLLALADGSRRYSQLGADIENISQKMLTQTLQQLERDGLVSRAVTPSVPIRTDYALTALGHTLLPLVVELKAWAEAHAEQTSRARSAYDLATRTADRQAAAPQT